MTSKSDRVLKPKDLRTIASVLTTVDTVQIFVGRSTARRVWDKIPLLE